MPKLLLHPILELTYILNTSKHNLKNNSFYRTGKTFPSLVVVARPYLRSKDSAAPSDRSTLDSKVKSVLMHTPMKFTEWLIQQGLVRSEQWCVIHPGNKLKLGKDLLVNHQNILITSVMGQFHKLLFETRAHSRQTLLILSLAKCVTAKCVVNV